MAQSAEKMFEEAMLREGRGFNGSALPTSSAPVKPAIPEARKPKPRKIREGEIEIGKIEVSGTLGLDLAKLMHGRLLVQGASGAGKSWTLRRLLEQTAGSVQQIVIDPEGEFSEYAKAYGLLTIDASQLDAATLGAAARRARELRISLRLDLSDLDREFQMIAVTAFFVALIDAPREHWYPCLVAVDEAHLFAPFGGQAREATAVRKSSIAAMTDLMSRGRKRGLAGVLATQRIARMAKSVISEAHNYLIGLNTLDVDIRRAAETIGWDARRGFDRLPLLDPGHFVAVGPAFSDNPCIVHVGQVATQQGGGTPVLCEHEMIAPEDAAQMMKIEELIEASAADARLLENEQSLPGTRAVRMFIRDPAFSAAARIWNELARLYPEGAMVSDLSTELPLTAEGVTEALALLDIYGVLEFMGEGSNRAVRLAPRMQP